MPATAGPQLIPTRKLRSQSLSRLRRSTARCKCQGSNSSDVQCEEDQDRSRRERLCRVHGCRVQQGSQNEIAKESSKPDPGLPGRPDKQREERCHEGPHHDRTSIQIAAQTQLKQKRKQDPEPEEWDGK